MPCKTLQEVLTQHLNQLMVQRSLPAKSGFSQRLLTQSQAAANCGFLVRTFVAWLQHGLLPPPSSDGQWLEEGIQLALKRVESEGCYEHIPQTGKTYAPLPNVHRVTRKLVDDRHSYHYYFRPTGTKLPSSFGSPEFMRALIECERRLFSDTQGAKTNPSNFPQRRIPKQTFGASNDSDTLGEMLEAGHPNLLSPKLRVRAELQASSERLTFLTPEELSARYRERVTIDTLANWRAAKVGPPFHKIGKTVLYRSDLLQQWEQGNLVLCGMADQE